MTDIDGTVYQTSDMIEEEVEHLAGRKANYLRPSFRGPNLRKQEITWIISFLEPVDEFRLFATSNFSRYLGENPAIAYHNPGCQGYCRPSQCTRAIRCSKCGKPERVHDGPMGAECTRPEKCANCHQPYPADHKECPVAPRNHNGEISKEELKSIRAFGDTLYLDVNTRSKK
ncbi:hypothetical protein N7528_006826 [Penicillium herquei]|nr:hypothetical protein N7528_006826 [Penicillium herquei]